MSAAPWAREYLTRRLVWADGGRDFARGRLDCLGFCALVWREVFGRELPEGCDEYESALDAEGVSAAMQAKLGDFERVSDPEPGDLAVLERFGLPTHVAVYAGGGYVLQMRECGVTLDRLRGALARSVEGYFRAR